VVLDFGLFKAFTFNDRVEIRVKNKEVLTILGGEMPDLKLHFPGMAISVVLDNKYKIENLTLDDVSQFKNHVEQVVTLLVKMISCEEKVTKNGSFFYNMQFELPGKKKFIPAKLFSTTPLQFKEGAMFIVKGRVKKEGSNYIKKNEQALGKDKIYNLSVMTIEEIEFKEDAGQHEVPRAELHCHTMYSKNDAFITPSDLDKAFTSNKLHTVAITDHGVAFSFNDFVSSLKKHKNDKKIILGCEFYAGDFDSYKEDMESHIVSQQNYIEETSGSLLGELDSEIEVLTIRGKEFTSEKAKLRGVAKRKTASTEDILDAMAEVDSIDREHNFLKETIKEKKEQVKEIKSQIESKVKTVEYYKNEFEKPTDIERDHLIVLLKSPDCEIDYQGEKVKINKGLVALYKLISGSYFDTFTAPTMNKQWGRRPMIDYKALFTEGVREHFVVGGACSMGKAAKLIIDGKEDEFREWIKKLDYIEIQPSHNNSYMIHHESTPNIHTMEDVFALHKRMYEIAQEEGVKVCFTSDAHINDKEEREYRKWFKQGYLGSIFKRMKEQEKIDALVADTQDESQPYILSHYDMVEDLQLQGFTPAEIEILHNNSNIIAEGCANAFEITLLPDKMFLPDFTGVNVKEEVPRLAWEYAIKKWSTNGEVTGIPSEIKDRLAKEINATAEKGYEVLYYISYWMCRESEKLGYLVGSRGSAGSMLLTLCLGVGENNPLPPHMLCEKCNKIEWIETELVGLDLADTTCSCGGIMKGDGLNIESHNFLGFSLEKIPDIDLNFSGDIQGEIHEKLIMALGSENVIKSGTVMLYQEDALKSNIFLHIPDIQHMVQNEEFEISYMSNNIKTMNSTGQHPGGLLVKNPNIPFEYVTPMIYSSDDPKKGSITSSFDYHTIEEQLIKIDALGHDDMTTLKELHETTGVDFKNIRFNDPKMYAAITDPTLLGINGDYPFPTTTTGISEMNTDFTMKMLAELKPQSMTDLIYFSGLSHGTNVYNGNAQREMILSGNIKMSEGIPVRDIIYQQLSKAGFDPAEAFTISEFVRKGKGIAKWETELREKMPAWYVDSMKQIKYLFPKAHAAAYVLNALRLFWYKMYYPTDFYAAILNRYGVGKSNNRNFNYVSAYEQETWSDLQRFQDRLNKETNNPAKIKDNQKICNIIWELKCRGISLEQASLISDPHKFRRDTTTKRRIFMPLLSVKGIGEKGAEQINNAYKEFGEELINIPYEALNTLVLADGTKPFGKKNLDALTANNYF
jgi:DNA polymerase III alpha subunit (gram-positive type)